MDSTLPSHWYVMLGWPVNQYLRRPFLGYVIPRSYSAGREHDQSSHAGAFAAFLTPFSCRLHGDKTKAFRDKIFPVDAFIAFWHGLVVQIRLSQLLRQLVLRARIGASGPSAFLSYIASFLIMSLLIQRTL